MPSVTIGYQRFKTKRDATAEARRILHTAEIDVVLSGKDGDFVAALYGLHPRKEDGPIGFCVGTNNYHGALTRGFQAIYADGLRKPWSYIPCFTPASDAPSPEKAMRAAIMLSQREALRAAYQGKALITCHFCPAGVELSLAQVHHMHPKFRDIADAFVGLIGAPCIETAELGDDFVNSGLKRRWILFHDAVAHRVVVCAKCNAEDERKDRVNGVSFDVPE